MVLENKFDRGDELDADKVVVDPGAEGRLRAGNARRLPHAPRRAQQGSAGAATACSRRIPTRKERIDKIRQQAGSQERPRLVEARYKANIKYKPTPVTADRHRRGRRRRPDRIDESRRQERRRRPTKKEEEPKKKGFGLGGLKQAVAPEKESAQVSASGGARGVGPDRAAKGGSNPAPVKVTVSSADVAEFKRGIA